MKRIANARKNTARKDYTTRPEFRRIFQYQGLISRVARELGLNPSHVDRVARGERDSRRVYKALVSAVSEIEGEDDRVA